MQKANYCTNCGAAITEADFFCRSCGRSLTSRDNSQQTPPDKRMMVTTPAQEVSPENPTPSSPAPVWQRVSVPDLFRSQTGDAGNRREALFGAGFALAVVVSALLVIYVALILKWAVGSADAPGLGGVLAFVLLHGGSLTLDVPATDALLGIGGTFSVDPPTTPFALVPFLIFLGGSWIAARRFSMSWTFVLAASLVYGILVGLSGLLGSTSVELAQDARMTLSSASFSSGGWAFLFATLGGMLGSSAGRGPILPEHIRQIVKGGFAAVGVSFAIALLLAFVIFLAGLAPDLSDLTTNGGSETPTNEPAQPFSDPQTPQGDPSQDEDTGDESGVFSGFLTATGTFFALLPSMVGSFWLLVNGMPVGLQNASDLASIPLIGSSLGDAPLSLSLVGDWPLSNTWRLLLISPVVGLVVGGTVAGRNAHNPLLSGALIAIPYTLVATVVSLLCELSLSLTVSAASIDLAFGTPMLWTLVLFPISALFGAVGGRLRRQPSAPLASHPKRAAAATVAVSILLIALTLPILFASVPSEADLPSLPGTEMPMMETPGLQEF